MTTVGDVLLRMMDARRVIENGRVLVRSEDGRMLRLLVSSGDAVLRGVDTAWWRPLDDDDGRPVLCDILVRQPYVVARTHHLVIAGEGRVAGRPSMRLQAHPRPGAYVDEGHPSVPLAPLVLDVDQDLGFGLRLSYPGQGDAALVEVLEVQLDVVPTAAEMDPPPPRERPTREPLRRREVTLEEAVQELPFPLVLPRARPRDATVVATLTPADPVWDQECLIRVSCTPPSGRQALTIECRGSTAAEPQMLREDSESRTVHAAAGALNLELWTNGGTAMASTVIDGTRVLLSAPYEREDIVRIAESLVVVGSP